MSPPQARLVDEHFVKLAGHRRLAHAAAAKEAQTPTQLRQADPLEVVAQFAEPWIGMVGDGQATNMIALPPQRLGHDNGKPTPGGKQADAAVR
jgi:hypothetical protein